MAFYGQNTIIKSQLGDNSSITYHYFHSKPKEDRVWDQPYLQFVAIDPAQKNFAIRIERRYHDGRIIPVVFAKYDIYGEIVSDPKNKTKDEDRLTSTTYSKLNHFLDLHLEHYKYCHYIIVERQLVKAPQMLKVMQHTIAYFSLTTKDMPLLPSVIEYNPKLRNLVFGFGKVDYNQGKKKSIAKAIELLEMRDDSSSLEIMKWWGAKKDDLADTVLMIEGFCIWRGYEPTRLIEWM